MKLVSFNKLVDNIDIIFTEFSFDMNDDLSDEIHSNLNHLGKRFFIVKADFNIDYIMGLENSNVNLLINHFLDLDYSMTLHEDESYEENLFYMIDIEDEAIIRIVDIDACHRYMARSVIDVVRISYSICNVRHILEYFKGYQLI